MQNKSTTKQLTLPHVKICPQCGLRPREATSRKRHEYHRLCWKCRRPSRSLNQNSRRKQRLALLTGQTCSRCGFVPEALVQLELHHRDGNPANQAGDNLVILCANCHSLQHH